MKTITMKSSDIQSRILETAGVLFYSQGYNSTGINQIIDESDIARASLYNHFKSKSELLYAYLEQTHNNWFAQLHEHIDSQQEPREKILTIFDFKIKRQVANNFGGCPFVKVGAEVSSDDKRAFDIINITKMKLRNLILEILQDIPLQGNPLSREQLADALYMLMEGATVTANFQKSDDMLIRAKTVASLMLS